MTIFLTTLLILLCLVIVLLILIQRTSGGMGSALGAVPLTKFWELDLLPNLPSLRSGNTWILRFSSPPLCHLPRQGRGSRNLTTKNWS